MAGSQGSRHDSLARARRKGFPRAKPTCGTCAANNVKSQTHMHRTRRHCCNFLTPTFVTMDTTPPHRQALRRVQCQHPKAGSPRRTPAVARVKMVSAFASLGPRKQEPRFTRQLPWQNIIIHRVVTRGQRARSGAHARATLVVAGAGGSTGSRTSERFNPTMVPCESLHHWHRDRDRDRRRLWSMW